MLRHGFRTAFAAALWLAALPLAAAQAQQPLKIIFPFAAGGSGDALTRIIADHLRAGLNRTVIVENVTGGAGRIAMRQVVTAAPDGNTILLTPIAPVVVYQHVYKDLGYDPFKDLKPLAHVAGFEFALAVGPKVPVKTLKELVDWAKANPKEASYGSPAAGSLPHFFGVLFARAAGVDFVHIGYRGSAPALADLAGGQIAVVVTTTSDLLAMHKAGRIRMLATSDNKRSPLVPEAPTFKEAGYDIEGTSWYAMFAPANTPDDVIQRYNKIIVEALGKQDVKDRLLALGLYATGSSPAELGKIQRMDSERWAPAVKASGFTPAQ
ncbi:MAG TPA: Bug family tripartite tricarboxylate transporter substrate binding protein [Xanthobacteraceae bacterium]|jgi:tripartite-type tricarboxylate transporter receptor subunit TctC